MLILLSFRMTSRSRPSPPAWLRASKAMPLAMAPSPMTATMRRPLPVVASAQAMPRAELMLVAVWPKVKAS